MRGLIVFMLILIAIAPFTKAASGYSNVVESSQDSLNMIMSSSSDKGNAAQSAGSSSTLQDQKGSDPSMVKLDSDYQKNINKDLSNINFKRSNLKETDNVASFNNFDAQSNTNDYLKYLSEKSIATNEHESSIAFADQNSVLRINSNLNHLYERDATDGHNLADARITSQNSASEIDSNLNYLYEKDTTNGHNLADARISSQNSTPEISSNMNYLYEKRGVNDRAISNLQIDRNIDNNKIINTRSGDSKNINKSYTDSRKARDYLYQLVTGLEEDQMDATGSASTINTLLGSLIENKMGVTKEAYPLFLSSLDYSKFQKDISNEFSESGLSNRKYAVVVGIDNYADRSSLHSSVNDANSISQILKSLGYDVIELTDQTANKPTKHNILEGALKEIGLKSDMDKVLIYFSGHGVVDNKDNFYLIPQDGDGNPASYIGEEELSSYIRGIKNLTIIIDSCNSGAFKATTGEGQVILTSSKDDEPSNEKWTEPGSVFTYFLCQAIKEEEQSNREIIIQNCFHKACNDTVQWSGSHLLSQTPMLRDNTNGRYSLS